MIQREYEVTAHTLALRVPFTIARGRVTEITVVRVAVRDGAHVGRGECRPYPRYQESPEDVVAALEAMRTDVRRGIDWKALGSRMPPGAARNALDCALVDLECKRSKRAAHLVLGVPPPSPLFTAVTISLDEPKAMRDAARQVATRPVLKLKLGGKDSRDRQRLESVREAAPNATLIVDANEGWDAAELAPMLDCAVACNVRLIEQPLPEGSDDALRHIERRVTICADESLHTAADLESLRDKYDAVNVKLDKAGGITHAIDIAIRARELGFSVMAGCMVSSSLAIAPALHLATLADFVDLDGPLWLRSDFTPSIPIVDSTIGLAPSDLWG